MHIKRWKLKTSQEIRKGKITDLSRVTIEPTVAGKNLNIVELLDLIVDMRMDLFSIANDEESVLPSSDVSLMNLRVGWFKTTTWSTPTIDIFLEPSR